MFKIIVFSPIQFTFINILFLSKFVSHDDLKSSQKEQSESSLHNIKQVWFNTQSELDLLQTKLESLKTCTQPGSQNGISGEMFSTVLTRLDIVEGCIRDGSDTVAALDGVPNHMVS